MTDIVDSKPIWKSKTFWFNVLTGAGTVAGALSGVLPPSLLPWAALINAVANVGLRFVSSSAVTLK